MLCRLGQFTRVLKVLVPENASAIVHLRKRVQARVDVALPQQTPRLRVLHHGSDKRSGQTLLSQGWAAPARSGIAADQIKRMFVTHVHIVSGNAHRTGVRRDPERYAARDISAGIRQQSVHVGVHDDDPGRKTFTDKRLGAVRNISVLHRVQVDDKKPT